MRTRVIMVYLLALLLLSGTLKAQGVDLAKVYVSRLGWNPDGTEIIVGFNYVEPQPCVAANSVSRMQVDTEKILAEYPSTCGATAVDFNSVQGDLLILAGSGMTLWDPMTNQKSFEIIYNTIFIDGVWDPQGTGFIALDRNSALIWDDIDNKPAISMYDLGIPRNREGPSFSAFDWGFDGHFVVLAIETGAIYVWEIATETVSTTFIGHKVKVNTISHHPISKLIASGDDNGTILIWSAANGEIIKTITDHSGAINDLDWSPDGNYLVSASADSTVKIWEISTGTELDSFDYGAPVHAVAWSPSLSENIIAFGGEGVEGQRGEVRFQTLDLTSLGLPLASAGSDQITSGNGTSALVTLDGSGSADPNGSITAYVWHENGKVLATGANPMLNLETGIHTITLTVTDNDNQTTIDEVMITVLAETATYTPSATSTATYTATVTPTYTLTLTPTFTPSFTYPPTFTPVFTRTPTATDVP